MLKGNDTDGTVSGFQSYTYEYNLRTFFYIDMRKLIFVSNEFIIKKILKN